MLYGIVNNDVPALPSSLVSALSEHDHPQLQHEQAQAVTTPQAEQLQYQYDQSPFRVAELSVELQIERLRLEEAIYARDVAVFHLEQVCLALREKNEVIARYEAQAQRTAAVAGDVGAEKSPKSVVEVTPPPKYEDEDQDIPPKQLNPTAEPFVIATPPRPATTTADRYAYLASLPLPSNLSEDLVQPVQPIPVGTSSIIDFLASLSDGLKSSLGNYRLLAHATTIWCPEKEEHGFFYVPLFKCVTNSRVSTAHMWSAVEVLDGEEFVDEFVDCFYNNVDAWYYAGSYKMFRMQDLTTAEWVDLPLETRQSICKDTVSGRKNISAQNLYEVSQLYSCGALKVACIGLQCVNFREDVYKCLLWESETFMGQRVSMVHALAGKLSLSHPASASSSAATSRARTPDVPTSRLSVPLSVRPELMRSASASLAEHGAVWNPFAEHNGLSLLPRPQRTSGGGEKKHARPAPAPAGKENIDPARGIAASLAALSMNCVARTAQSRRL